MYTLQCSFLSYYGHLKKCENSIHNINILHSLMTKKTSMDRLLIAMTMIKSF